MQLRFLVIILFPILTAQTAVNGGRAFSASPTVPAPTFGDNTTKVPTTSFVQQALASLNPITSVDAATTTVLSNSPTYSNGTAGVGATLTAGSNGVLTIDGHACVLNDRLLIKNQASGLQNGIYDMTTEGTSGAAYILTRSTDFNTAVNMDNTSSIPVINGTANASTLWFQTATITTVGTDALVFTQIGGTQGPQNNVGVSQGAYPPPIKCKKGDIYFFTSPVYSRAFCSATNTWTYFLSGLGSVTPPATLSFSWQNQTSATIDTIDGFAYFDCVNNGGSNHKWKLRTMSIPSSSNPYTLTVFFRFPNQIGNGQVQDRFGIVIFDSGTGKFIGFNLSKIQADATVTTVAILAWTDTTTYGGTTYLSTDMTTAGAFWLSPTTQYDYGLRIVTDSTNTTYYTSGDDGYSWQQMFQHSKNTFVTPDSVGFGCSCYDANLKWQIDSFSLTQP